jgi:hypothetical protein
VIGKGVVSDCKPERIFTDGTLTIAICNIKKHIEKICEITKRNRVTSFEQVISELNPIPRGLHQYF